MVRACCVPAEFVLLLVDPITIMVLPQYPDARSTALFLDFDGTLVEITDRPDAISLAEETRSAVDTIARHAGGALAIVTGREIATIDAFVSPLRLPIAGVHGFARRDAAGRMQVHEVDEALLGRAADELAALCQIHSGLFIERKSGSVALHYRARPELAHMCAEMMEQVFGKTDGYCVTRGKMVIEARPKGADKGSAILAFMAEPPFLGRVPLVAGDDLTDEDAFAAVNRVGGISIKIGEGPTVASLRVPTTSEFVAWLIGYAQHLEGAVDFERT